MSLKVEMFDFDKVHRLIHNLEDETEKIILRELRKFGLHVEGIVKKHISNQDLNWKPLSESYKKYKLNKGLSENIYVATSSYFQAITSYVDEKGMVVFIGIKQETKTKDGQPLHNIVVWNTAHEKCLNVLCGNPPQKNP